MTTIQEYVVSGGQAVTAGEVDAFRRHFAAYKLKIELLEGIGQSVLRERASFLIRFVEDVLDGEYDPTDFAALPEAIFAVKYLAKGIDIIPDSLPDVGYTDDNAVVASVISGHQKEFEAYCTASGLLFSAIAE